MSNIEVSHGTTSKLLREQGEILFKGIAGGKLLLEILDDERDRGQGRAEFMRRRRRQTVELR